VTGLKHAVGRSRPLCRCSPLTFAAAGPGRAFPSGHTAAAFATATVLARHTDRTWLRAGLYGAAALTGWSRMNDDKHWLSDVAAGAALGVLAGRAVTGRGHPRRAALPWWAVGPAGPAVGWLVEF
jgi:membrane-associated phospholipid phosphatase